MVEFSQLMYGLATTGARRRSCLRAMTQHLVQTDRVGVPQQRMRQAADRLRTFGVAAEKIFANLKGRM